jgi:hypothetical protein
MNLPNASKGPAIAVLLLFATACGDGSNDKPACTEPNIDGSPFGSTGTATVHGTGTLPPGMPEGYQIELLLNTGNASIGVLPPNLFEPASVCGRSFSYTIENVEAGTYRLDFELRPPNSTATDPTASGTSTNDFTVTDGQDVEFDATF